MPDASRTYSAIDQQALVLLRLTGCASTTSLRGDEHCNARCLGHISLRARTVAADIIHMDTSILTIISIIINHHNDNDNDHIDVHNTHTCHNKHDHRHRGSVLDVPGDGLCSPADSSPGMCMVMTVCGGVLLCGMWYVMGLLCGMYVIM